MQTIKLKDSDTWIRNSLTPTWHLPQVDGDLIAVEFMQLVVVPGPADVINPFFRVEERWTLQRIPFPANFKHRANAGYSCWEVVEKKRLSSMRTEAIIAVMQMDDDRHCLGLYTDLQAARERVSSWVEEGLAFEEIEDDEEHEERRAELLEDIELIAMPLNTAFSWNHHDGYLPQETLMSCGVPLTDDA